MAFSKETFGTLENGAVITKYTLTNKHGLKASFTDLGGIWLEMWATFTSTGIVYVAVKNVNLL